MTPAFAVWLTGLPGSGKSTIARALHAELADRGVHAAVLESDVLRPVLMPGASYNEEDRNAFYHALAFVGSLLVTHGVPVIFDATASRRSHRSQGRATIDRFVEVYVECPLEVCMARDPKGLYRQAQAGGVTNLPGLQAGYEPPDRPDLVVSGEHESPKTAAQAIATLLENRSFIRSRPSLLLERHQDCFGGL
jgi:adenylylsulfate kinase